MRRAYTGERALRAQRGGSTWSTWLGDIRSRVAILDVSSVDGHHRHHHVLKPTLLLFTQPSVLATLSASITTDLGLTTTHRLC